MFSGVQRFRLIGVHRRARVGVPRREAQLSASRSVSDLGVVLMEASDAIGRTSWIFGHRVHDAGLLGSMGRVAFSVDNPMIKSFWSTPPKGRSST